MNTSDKIKFLENLLKEANCPTWDITPMAMQILRDCEKNNKSVYDVELC